MITIINYNAGNIKSIQNMLKRIGAKSIISSSAEEIAQADKLILPGVGSFDYGMKNLQQSGLIEILNEKVINNKTPILGICLGAQLLGNNSEEGIEKGLGWIDMDIVKFDKSKMTEQLKIPHMSWNEVVVSKKSMLMEGLEDEARFYFVHTYHMQPENENDVLTKSNYGYEFVSAVEKENIFGVQFHPEKSHKFGMRLLQNFVNL
ncbi:MAG: imidazole glycerol phosphate synthase subunit HisH [Flavobacteriales bacterium]|nr:imidazole glycerol phosphate synthase subunit HisH [Flavobacteriales bacterium]MCW8913369.1 imidazole glycerol phosphate synthase subunit HisH [Flavobacteriales bacterium]MCW8938843.1 imidazole glycerol phosphate synthase subunit HisH [Flavobacteriales bacterium]MCW8939735.1 imidazole glycerol phosphate synthase subunit HisH [Flavobacteriales bacterium]MCW8969446.1 imidazole glycerol phosphate synthase subunit HisH [Flavobacteriales bacterium]